jgi:hypothetical protein
MAAVPYTCMHIKNIFGLYEGKNPYYSILRIAAPSILIAHHSSDCAIIIGHNTIAEHKSSAREQPDC